MLRRHLRRESSIIEDVFMELSRSWATTIEVNLVITSGGNDRNEEQL